MKPIRLLMLLGWGIWAGFIGHYIHFPVSFVFILGAMGLSFLDRYLDILERYPDLKD